MNKNSYAAEFFYVIKVQKSLFEPNCPFLPYFSQKWSDFNKKMLNIFANY